MKCEYDESLYPGETLFELDLTSYELTELNEMLCEALLGDDDPDPVRVWLAGRVQKLRDGADALEEIPGYLVNAPGDVVDWFNRRGER